MKKLFLILTILLLSVSSFSQTLRDSVNWETPYYRIIYSEVLEQPRAVWYTVICPNGTASRTGMDFHTELNIKTSDNADYINNEWDKGHMAPAASLNCTKEMLLTTFSYTNSALQQQSLNRGVWKKLEIQERTWAQTNTVTVYIRIEFDKTPKRVATNAAIPKGFYKELIVGNVKHCYYFPNTIPISSDLNKFKCNCR
jgi:DNA/RNA endonuclease G (NUC1)